MPVAPICRAVIVAALANAAALAQPPGQLPIHLVYVNHVEVESVIDYVPPLVPGRAYNATVARYEFTRGQLDWEVAEAESAGARVSFHMSGAFAERAAAGGHQALWSRRLADGHTAGVHFHSFLRGPGAFQWTYQPSPTPQQIAQAWTDNHGLVAALVGAGALWIGESHYACPPCWQALGYRLATTEQMALLPAGQHIVWLVERGPTGTITYPHFPQIGEAGWHGPQGNRIFFDLRLPQLKKELLMLYMEWLERERLGLPAQVWCFGWLNHGGSNTQRHAAAIREMFAWTRAGFAGRTSPRGHTIARFVNDHELSDIYTDYLRWGTPLPSPRTNVNDRFPHMAEALADAGVIEDLTGRLGEPGIRMFEMERSPPLSPPPGPAPRVYLLFRETDGTDLLDLRPLLLSRGVPSPTLLRIDVSDGTRSAVAATAVPVGPEPAVLEVPVPGEPMADALWAANASPAVRSISKIDPAGRILLDVPFPAASPRGLAVDPFGNVWAGSDGAAVVKLDPLGNVLGTFNVGSSPQAVASDAAGNLWVAHRTGYTVTKLGGAGAVLATAALPAGASPAGVVVDRTGGVWVSGAHSGTSTMHSLFRLDASANVTNIHTYGPSAGPGHGFSFPAVDSGNDLWVPNEARQSVLQIDQDGAVVSETTGLAASGPGGCAVDGLGFCWVAVPGPAGGCVKIDQRGVIVGTFLLPSTTLTHCAIDGHGDVWAFGHSPGMAVKLWQPDMRPLATVALPAGARAWGGDAGGFHNAAHLNPEADFDGDGSGNLAEILAGTSPLSAASTPLKPLPVLSGIARPGGGVSIGVRLRDGASLAYAGAASFGTAPGIPLPDGRVIPLNPDPLLLASFLLPAVFQGFTGVTNATGDALMRIDVPSEPGLAGLAFHVAYVLLDPGAPSGIRTVSSPLRLTVE